MASGKMFSFLIKAGQMWRPSQPSCPFLPLNADMMSGEAAAP